MHTQAHSGPRAVPGKNASSFFFFLEKGRFQIALASLPVFLLQLSGLQAAANETMCEELGSGACSSGHV